MTDPIVGIDLGTTNTVIAICDDGGNPRVLADDHGAKIHPSVVSFHPNGSVVVGAEAKQRKVIDPRNTVYSAKRLIGRGFRSREIQAAMARMPYTIKEGVNQAPVIVTRAGEFAVPEVSAIILDHVRNIARKALATEVSRAVITVPASFNDAQRSATATAGAIAGLTVVRVLNEPTAAALAYGHQKQLNRTIAVYDFGGGTFDITVLRLDDQVYEVLGTAGDSFLGGDDLDERLVDHMVASFLAKHRIDLRENEVSIMRLRAVAEQTKIELSRRTRAIVKVDEVAYGPGGAPLDLELEITRDELVSRVADVVERTFPVCEEAMKVAGLVPNDIEEIVLVGGTTKMPHVRDRVTRFFGKTPRTDVNPEEVVAVGAALQAAALNRILSAKRQTARSTAPPPGGLLEQRPATEPPPVPRTTAPRIAPDDPIAAGVDEPTGVKNVRRTTAPLGVELRPPATKQMPAVPAPRETERAATRGASVDRFEEPKTDPAARPLGRITKPGAPVPPPAPTAQMPVPTAGPSAKTLFGVPAAPAPTTAQPPARPPVELRTDFEELATDARGFESTTGVGFEVPTNPMTPIAVPPTFAPPPTAATSPTLMMQPAIPLPPPAQITPPPQFAPSPAPPIRAAAASMPTMITGAPAPTFAPPSPAPLVQAVIAAQPPATPMVLDVTPASFGIGTVAGYCEELIRRNARVPTEMKRMFTTSRDRQTAVRIRVCQGESRRIEENVVLGDLVLDNLEQRPRGETTIEVTFAIDASGILQVRARDARTGREQRASLEVMGRQSPAEVAAAQGRLRELRR